MKNPSVPLRPGRPGRPGFTLVEILLSLLVMAGSIGLYVSGMQAAELLDRQARGEDRAARIAERELELLKNDLLAARRPPQGVARGRFRLPAGWKTQLRWAPFENEGTVRMAARVTQRAGVDLQVESFLFLPSLVAPADPSQRGDR